MNDSTMLQQQGYKGVKITSMIKAIQQQEIFPHLRLVQQDEFRRIQNRYNKNGYLTKPYFQYLWLLYWNFVLNDFRFEDKSKDWSIPIKRKVVKPEHIGLQLLKELTEKSK